VTSYQARRVTWSDQVGGNTRDKETEELRETDEQLRDVSKVSSESEGGCGLLSQLQVNYIQKFG